MKLLVSILTLTLLVSCGGKEESSKSKSESSSYSEEGSGYVMPKIGYHKVIKLNPHLEFLYELLTINPNNNGEVLGDMPFFVEVSLDNEVEVNFYYSHYLKSVSYIDLGNKFKTKKISNFNSKNLPTFKNIKDFGREFTYGKAQTYYLEQDMLNKVFLVETEASESPYKSNMKTLIWIECVGAFKYKSQNDYSCETDALRFNYKLIDYKLTEEN